VSYLVDYSIHEVVNSADEAARALRPIKGGVVVREAINRADAAAQAMRDLCDAGIVLGRHEEIRMVVKDGA
jgi:hypothetical protein